MFQTTNQVKSQMKNGGLLTKTGGFNLPSPLEEMSESQLGS